LWINQAFVHKIIDIFEAKVYGEEKSIINGYEFCLNN